MFPGFHEEAAGGAEADRVDAVGVAVEVDLEYSVRIVDIEVGSDTGSGLVLGPVDADLLPLVGTCLQLKLVHGVGAGQCATEPAAVGQVLGQ